MRQKACVARLGDGPLTRRGSAAVAHSGTPFPPGKFSQRRDRVKGPCMATEGFSSGLLAAYVGDSDPDGIPVDLDGG